MKIEDHLRNINESLDTINDAIMRSIDNRQRTIGFNTSVASVEMLEVYLHNLGILNPGALLKHDWFTSINHANKKLMFDFPDKEKIIKILCDIESKRNILCYGKKQPLSKIKEVIDLFNEIKSLFESRGLKWN
jgi:hypothetical protein